MEPYSINVERITNTDQFRPAALHFLQYGHYCVDPKGTSAYFEYWDEETNRCINGYTSPEGNHITGYFYYYLNYFQIDQQVNGKSVKTFPRYYDYDKVFFDTIEQCELKGKHLAVLKARRKGYSYKIAAMLCRNFYFIENSSSYAYASQNEFLTKDGILTKAWNGMDFVDENTAWYKKRQKIDRQMHKRASFIVDREGVKIELGYKSEIIGVTLKNDVQKIRGKKAKLIIFEEAGKFPNLKEAWQIGKPSVQQGDEVFGLMIAFGCVCAGTKVWTKDGRFINIENLQQEDGIIGYNTYSTVEQDILQFREPYETDCVKITTNSGRSLECSKDHPIIYSHRTLSKRVPGRRMYNEYMKSWKWKEAKDFKIGDQVGVIEEVSHFGIKEMWNPRLIGWLIGDGSYGVDKTPRLSNCEDEINSYIDEHFDTVIEKQYDTKDGKKYRETRIKNICYRLRELGIYGQVKELKRLPQIIFECKKEDVCELIGGLFDTDGYITNPVGRSGHRIILTSAYKELLLEVSQLLLKLGIHAKINFIKPNLKNKKDKNGYYRLIIADKKSLISFVNTIKFYPKEKNRRALLYNESLKDRVSEISKYIHGLRFERIIKIEEIGLKKVYNIKASDTHTYIANGFITHNTGGTEDADFEGLRDLFYEPDTYNCLPIVNKWDDNASKPAGFFVPTYYNLSDNFMDSDGNSFVKEAIKYELGIRDNIIKSSSDKTVIDRHIAEYCFNPREATLDISTNIFPKADLIAHLAYIRNNQKIRDYKQTGDLISDETGKIIWRQENPKDLTSYKVDRGKNVSGQIVIWEHPIESPPFGMYIAGIDPYDHDQSNTNSLGSIFIYKQFQTFDSTYNILVAEYTGRPKTAEIFYEKCRKLLVYYNAKALYENQNPGLLNYFKQNHCDYLLADQPDLILKIVGSTTVQRIKGMHMTKEIKSFGEGLIKDYLIQERADGRLNLHTLLSEPLIEELIYYNDKGNFDRVMSYMQIMFYKEELHNVIIKDRKEENKVDPFFNTFNFNDYERVGNPQNINYNT
jgi:intein/homing endonuclease